jgi:hypothetical protein
MERLEPDGLNAAVDTAHDAWRPAGLAEPEKTRGRGVKTQEVNT